MREGCLSMLETLGLVLGLIHRQICDLVECLGGYRTMLGFVGDVGTICGPHS